MPYPAVLGSFKGDWFDAAQIYRKWALKQIWASKGPLYQRHEPYRWYDQVNLMCRQNTRTQDQTMERARKNSLEVAEEFEGPVASQWYTWNVFDPSRSRHIVTEEIAKHSPWLDVNDKATPPSANIHAGWMLPAKPGFKEVVTELNEKAFYCFTFVPAQLLDQGNPDYSESEPHQNLTRSGKRRIHSASWPLALMCVGTEYWRDKLANLCQDIAAQYNVKGIYLDTLGLAREFCFDPKHGHPLGVGKFHHVGQRAIAEKVRAAVSKVDPEIVLLAENPSETLIDVIDGRHCREADEPYMTLSWQTVYADYWNIYPGTSYRVGNVNKEPAASMQLANTFVQGSQFGRLSLISQATIVNDPQAGPLLQYLKKLVNYRKAALAYLSYGRLLRPLELSGSIPTITSPVKRGPYYPAVPAILHSTWQAPDGSIGMVFTNLDKNSHEFSFSLAQKHWDVTFPADAILQVIGEDGAVNKNIPVPENSALMTWTLNGHDVLFIRLK